MALIATSFHTRSIEYLTYLTFIQGMQRAMMGNVKFAGKKLKKLREKGKKEARNEDRTHIREALIYFVFMFFFCACTMRGLFNSELFWFGENVRKQFVETQIQTTTMDSYSPAWGKTWSVEEKYFHVSCLYLKNKKCPNGR
jgi:predicted ABC-type transport system involved in lysophospholipase L1 biosynthesis ATPase subunit